MFKALLAALLALFITSALNANELGGYAGASLRLPGDAITAGSGGITIFGDASTFSFGSNPASLGRGQGRRISASLANLSLDRYLNTAGVILALPPTAQLGVGVQDAGTRGIEARDSRGYYAGDLQDEERFIVVAFANRVSDALDVGVTLKLLNRQFTSIDDSWLDLAAKGFGVNIGVSLEVSETSQLALSVRDINSSYNWKTGNLFSLASSYREVFPANLAWGWQQTRGNIGIKLEHNWYFIGAHVGRVAIDWQPMQTLTLRGGSAIDSDGISPGAGASYEFALGRNTMQVDLGFVLGVAGEGLRSYLGWSFEF